ncbi:hypothetical protein ACFX2I_014168 [Malus domestica]
MASMLTPISSRLKSANKSTRFPPPKQFCMTLTRSVWLPATQTAFTWTQSMNARCVVTGVVVTWAKVTSTAEAKARCQLALRGVQYLLAEPSLKKGPRVRLYLRLEWGPVLGYSLELLAIVSLWRMFQAKVGRRR